MNSREHVLFITDIRRKWIKIFGIKLIEICWRIETTISTIHSPTRWYSQKENILDSIFSVFPRFSTNLLKQTYNNQLSPRKYYWFWNFVWNCYWLAIVRRAISICSSRASLCDHIGWMVASGRQINQWPPWPRICFLPSPSSLPEHDMKRRAVKSMNSWTPTNQEYVNRSSQTHKRERGNKLNKQKAKSSTLNGGPSNI